MWCNLHMLLDILEFRVENKKNYLGKTVLKVWSQILRKMAFMSTKLLFRKNLKTKIKLKNNENVKNLWRILGTTLVLLVNFWYHIFKTVFLQQFFLFSTISLKMSRNMHKLRHKLRNGQNLPHESPNFPNYIFLTNFTYHFGHFSRSLRPHYHNSLF